MSVSRKPRRGRTLGPSAGSSAGSSKGPSDPGSSRRGSPRDDVPSPDAKPELMPEDVVVVHSRTEDGKGMNVVRKRGDELSLGVVRPLEEGKPLFGDVVKLKPREEHPALFDVETEVRISQPQPARSTAGPSRVANSSYRKGWDSIWGGRRRRRKPN